MEGANGQKLCLDSGDAGPTQPPMVVRACDKTLASQRWALVPKGTCENKQACVHHIINGVAAAPAGGGLADSHCLDVYGKNGPQLDVFGCFNMRPLSKSTM